FSLSLSLSLELAAGAGVFSGAGVANRVPAVVSVRTRTRPRRTRVARARPWSRMELLSKTDAKRRQSVSQGPRRAWMTAGLLSLAAVGGISVIILASFVLMEGRFLYFPTRRLAAKPESFGLRADELSLLAEDGVRLHGWWIKGVGGRVLLFFHG